MQQLLMFLQPEQRNLAADQFPMMTEMNQSSLIGSALLRRRRRRRIRGRVQRSLSRSIHTQRD
jgi:hypothetical protein